MWIKYLYILGGIPQRPSSTAPGYSTDKKLQFEARIITQ